MEHSCSPLIFLRPFQPSAKKSKLADSCKENVTSVGAKVTVKRTLICSNSIECCPELRREHCLQCCPTKSPLKRVQQNVMIESPQKAEPLRASAASLFFDSLLFCDANGSSQADKSAVGQRYVKVENAAALEKEQWNDELAPITTSAGVGGSCGQKEFAVKSSGAQRSYGYMKRAAVKRSAKSKKASAARRDDNNYVRLNIKKKNFVRVRLNAKAKRRKFGRNKSNRRP
ncbi:unnamed protein product [Toxocara canis]|uniref:Uncharacterized protein n=1 Tax=Toxocara canis TaxID=6265 RepID=A0A183UYG0_TOXCA|nr:unnamed protein product [Toxocara canis]